MSRRVVWSVDAQRDVHELVSYAADLDTDFAGRLYGELEDTAQSLAAFDTGRPGRSRGTREKSLTKRRLIMIYRVERHRHEELVLVLRVIHTARSRPADELPDD